MTTRNLLLAVSVAIVASSCASSLSTAGEVSDGSTTSVVEVVEVKSYDVGQMSLYAVATVTLGDRIDAVGGRTLFSASVDQKYHDIGKFTRNADPTVVDRTLDASEIEIFVPDYLLVDTGESLTVALSTRPYEDRDVWTVRVALTSDGLTVHQNEQPGIKQSLALASNPGETLLETLVVLSEEFREWLAARDEAMTAVRSQGRDAMLDAAREVPRGERHERLDAIEEAVFEASRPDTRLIAPEPWIAASPVDRQLPFSLEVLSEWTADERKRAGVQGWVEWRFSVVADEATRSGSQWVGVYFDGYGYAGPIGLNSGVTTFTTIGPPRSPLVVLTWGPGTPDVAFATNDPARGTGSRRVALDRSEFPADFEAPAVGQSILFDLRGGTVADFSILSASDLDDLVSRSKTATAP